MGFWKRFWGCEHHRYILTLLLNKVNTTLFEGYGTESHLFFCVSPTGTSCSSKGPVRRLCCQGRGRDTPWPLARCILRRPGLSLAAAWPDHCLPSTSLTAAATGSVRPCPPPSSPSPWPSCSHMSSVSYRRSTLSERPLRYALVCSDCGFKKLKRSQNRRRS